MADYFVRIDSALDISETESRCEVEQSAGYRLDSIKFDTVIENGEVFTINLAQFFFESSFKILNDLHFVPVGSGDANAISEQKKAQGWIPICNSEIYVSGAITHILVFGKRS